ncbi:MAG: hypothetical protein KGI38_09045 [Thaumarchaeota archaeon]|nr:hypothetical protein [Nitrososphaerota archaeon]
MSHHASLISDFELRYPFTPSSRNFFESISLDEMLASREVLALTESRLLNSLARGKYEPDFSERGLSSFFAAALVASQDPVLASKFSKKEAERAKEFFKDEKPAAKVTVFAGCFGMTFQMTNSDYNRPSYTVPFEGYLSLVSKHNLAKNLTWKLARQELAKGVVRMSDNMLNDFFGDCALAAISEGVRNFRKAPFPKQLLGVKMAVIQYAPSPRPKTNKGYLYVEELLKHPAVNDGRHRLTWLVLSPWAIGVKLLPDEEAIELIQSYVSAGGNVDSGMRRFIAYNVRRARRLGLMPPTLGKLKIEHPDIYALLPKEVLLSSTEDPRPSRGKSTK